MNINIKESELIKNSIGESFNFYIDKKNNLVFNKFNNKNTLSISLSEIDSNVLSFSVIIDENDIIHLIYLIKNGDLIYCTYVEENWIKKLVFKLDTKSNIYKNLTLLISNNSINIFYAYTNLVNVNLWNIEQITKNNTRWEKKAVTSIFSKKVFSPFYIDYDSLGNIHLVLKANEHNSTHIYYIFYNVFIKKWSQSTEKISFIDTYNIFPYLFIDSKNNIHILWSSLENKDYTLKYKRLSHIGKNKYKWNTIDLPHINNITYTPVMIETNETLKIIYLKNNEIGYLNSINYGESWRFTNKTKLSDLPIWFIKYSSNIQKKYSNNKIHYIYGIIDENISLFFNGDEFYKESTMHSNNKTTKLQQNELNFVDKNEFTELKKTISEIKKTSQEIFTISDNILSEINIIKEKINDIDKQKSKKSFFNFK
ncbi:MAG: hypothetical protein KZY61_14050 [Clostridiaceae bacterium]|nr:hypothetical protein [Clostridiaceae bacterium]MBW4859816.1 hypothetical protein [Clostridiaceae bacterium]MBW4869754.1 hypothetical protein [Clostridiaceae bacterium]